ncbi:putative vacuolar ATP synthase subunit d [Besnoitia besnoiti]|uniref:V-type proton ATPase subunit n=1 Tax=Besnoitia besnoiti TaxID=94643 RepID=A0A2A9MPX2_BESBE|nr:putative vacuolar ATP synthase subunit d [Besnoitia besnoiti]PFH37922.1 putative vacuolar ATP synthase subunit d [Besnoitia besnoiti]
MELSFFNVDDGYLEGICRGLRSAFLTEEDYKKLAAADSLEDLRSALEETDYGPFMQDEPLPLAVPTLSQKCREKMAAEFRYLRSQAYGPLGKFLDFIATEKMIDNVVGLIQGAINRKSAHELLARVDPMGYFQEMAAIANMDLTTSYEELYRALLIDTPVGKYFQAFLAESASQAAAHAEQGGHSLSEVASIVSETDIELMRNSLKKGWLEDFYAFSQSLGGTTKEVMTHILKTEADFRVLRLVVNSLSSNQQQQMDRQALYPSFGYLYPEGTDGLRKAWNDSTVRATLAPYSNYLNLYEQCKSFYVGQEGQGNEAAADLASSSKFKSLEDLLYNETANMCELAFEQQFHYGIYYAWVKLKEQEIRNIVWIADMILMKRKEFISDQIVPLFLPRV